METLKPYRVVVSEKDEILQIDSESYYYVEAVNGRFKHYMKELSPANPAENLLFTEVLLLAQNENEAKFIAVEKVREARLSLNVIRFRYHRGTLQDSLLTVIFVSSKIDLKNSICTNFGISEKEEYELEIVPHGYDERIEWSTYRVSLVTKTGEKLFAGFSDGIPAD